MLSSINTDQHDEWWYLNVMLTYNLLSNYINITYLYSLTQLAPSIHVGPYTKITGSFYTWQHPYRRVLLRILDKCEILQSPFKCVNQRSRRLTDCSWTWHRTHLQHTAMWQCCIVMTNEHAGLLNIMTCHWHDWHYDRCHEQCPFVTLNITIHHDKIDTITRVTDALRLKLKWRVTS